MVGLPDKSNRTLGAEKRPISDEMTGYASGIAAEKGSCSQEKIHTRRGSITLLEGPPPFSSRRYPEEKDREQGTEMKLPTLK